MGERIPQPDWPNHIKPGYPTNDVMTIFNSKEWKDIVKLSFSFQFSVATFWQKLYLFVLY